MKNYHLIVKDYNGRLIALRKWCFL
jgi:hypothetical protein